MTTKLNAKRYTFASRSRLNAGFTLIELLVVISIIGVLSALALSNYNAARQRARDAQRKSDLNQIKTSLQMYYNDNSSSFPLSLVFGSALENPTDSSMVYMKVVPNDPSYDVSDEESPQYSYSSDGTEYCLVTNLENGSDKDLANSQLRCEACSASGSEYVVCPD